MSTRAAWAFWPSARRQFWQRPACSRSTSARAASAALAATAAATAAGLLPLDRRRRPLQAEESAAPEVSSRLAALHLLLLDLAKVPDARAADSPLPRLLEDFWDELDAAGLPATYAELFLHRLADSYSHGTLRHVQEQQLVQRLHELGVDGVLDPLAHSGFHAWRLARHGLRVEAADSNPAPTPWCRVERRPASDTSWESHADGWALLLSWLPHWSEVGAESLQAFRGETLIVLGDEGGWTGTERFREEMQRHWVPLHCWSTGTPWPRVDEWLRVFRRRAG